MTGMLEGKNAIIYGAAGGIGRGVAQAFAREGARVFLAGRREAPLQALATAISEAGGEAQVPWWMRSTRRPSTPRWRRWSKKPGRWTSRSI